MNPMLMMALAGMAMGAIKGQQDKAQEHKDREVAATTAQWSPWTGMAPGAVAHTSPMNSIMQGGMGGAGLGQSMAQNEQYNKWLEGQKTAPPPAMNAVDGSFVNRWGSNIS